MRSAGPAYAVRPDTLGAATRADGGGAFSWASWAAGRAGIVAGRCRCGARQASSSHRPERVQLEAGAPGPVRPTARDEGHWSRARWGPVPGALGHGRPVPARAILAGVFRRGGGRQHIREGPTRRTERHCSARAVRVGTSGAGAAPGGAVCAAPRRARTDTFRSSNLNESGGRVRRGRRARPARAGTFGMGGSRGHVRESKARTFGKSRRVRRRRIERRRWQVGYSSRAARAVWEDRLPGWGDFGSAV